MKQQNIIYDTPSEWLKKNRRKLAAYAGEWIAYNNEGIISHHKSGRLAAQEARATHKQYVLKFVHPFEIPRVVRLVAVFTLAFFLYCGSLLAQNEANSYSAELEKHRVEYVKDLLAPPKPLIKEEDAARISFFPADERYKINADFVLTPNEETIEMATSAGKVKTYRKYGVATFQWAGKKVQVAIFQSLALLSNPLYKDYLFLPFKDLTTGETTYGAGRYIDCHLSDIKDGKIKIDFNKCYNPYCAYSDGYNCPIPPAENELDIAIEAGIKTFDKH